MAVDYRKLWVRLAEKDISKAAFREILSISPATMTKLNKNNYVMLEVLEKICRVLNCDIGDIVSLMPGEQDELIPPGDSDGSNPFYLKFIAFVGSFKEGRRELKKIAYFADGAPSDKVRAFTEYLVVGDGGEGTQVYKENEGRIKKGYLVAMSPKMLKDIAAGRVALPEPTHIYDPDVTVFTSEEAKKRSNKNWMAVWKRDRDQFRAELAKAEPHIKSIFGEEV